MAAAASRSCVPVLGWITMTLGAVTRSGIASAGNAITQYRGTCRERGRPRRGRARRVAGGKGCAVTIGVSAGSICIAAALGKNNILRAVGMVCRRCYNPVVGNTDRGAMAFTAGNIRTQRRRLTDMFGMHASGKYRARRSISAMATGTIDGQGCSPSDRFVEMARCGT